jgi:flagellar hook capping protein FlgD
MKRPPPYSARSHPGRLPISFAVLLALVSAAPARAQFSLPAFSMSAGGGRAAGGTFVLDGTASPAQAGHASGGSFILDGGWGGAISIVGVPGEPGPLPAQFALSGARPNPCVRSTAIAFALPQAADVRLGVYDVRGRRVRELVATTVAPGRHTVEWTGAGDDGRALANGIYFVRFDADAYHAISRVVLLH